MIIFCLGLVRYAHVQEYVSTHAHRHTCRSIFCLCFQALPGLTVLMVKYISREFVAFYGMQWGSGGRE